MVTVFLGRVHKDKRQKKKKKIMRLFETKLTLSNAIYNLEALESIRALSCSFLYLSCPSTAAKQQQQMNYYPTSSTDSFLHLYRWRRRNKGNFLFIYSRN